MAVVRMWERSDDEGGGQRQPKAERVCRMHIPPVSCEVYISAFLTLRRSRPKLREPRRLHEVLRQDGALATLFVVAGSSAAFAQSAIAGVVKDGSGAVLPGVTVEATSPALIEGISHRDHRQRRQRTGLKTCDPATTS